MKIQSEDNCSQLLWSSNIENQKYILNCDTHDLTRPKSDGEVINQMKERSRSKTGKPESKEKVLTLYNLPRNKPILILIHELLWLKRIS